MSNKILSSGELLSQLNKNIDKTHHQKQKPNDTNQKIMQNQQHLKGNINISEKDNDKIQTTINNQVNIVKSAKKQLSVDEQVLKKQKQIKQIIDGSQVQSRVSRQSRVSQIRNKKSSFKQSFERNLSIQQQQVGQTLHEILAQQIGKLISQPLAQVIESAMKQKQKSIYIAYTQTDKDYLQELLKVQMKKDNNNLNVIEALLNRRYDKTLDKLENGQLFIQRQRSVTTKTQIEQLQHMDVARLMKIKQGSIRSKLDLLNDKMFQFDNLNAIPDSKSLEKLKKYQQQRLQEISDPHNFSLNSEKTKIANDYVKHLQQQKLLLLRKMRQRQQKRQQIQLQRSVQQKQAISMRQMAKKQQISQKIQQYRKKKQSTVQQNKQKQKKVQQFLKQYRKSLPLYRKKQKQFKQRYIKKQSQQRQQKLKQIKQQRRSLSLVEIKDHQDKYLQKKIIQQKKRQEQFKMIINAKKANHQKKYFKGFFSDKVKLLDQQEKIKFYSMRQNTKLKVQRMSQFDKQIRKKHIPKIDIKKKQELQRVIQFDELKKKKIKKIFKQVPDENGGTKVQAFYQQIPQVNHYKVGNQYMQISKSLGKKIKQEDSQNQSQQVVIDLQSLEDSKMLKSQISTDWQAPSKLIMQEKDVWRLRGKQLHQMTDDINPQTFNQIKKNLQIMDDKAKLRQQLLKHKDSDAHQLMHEKNMLDQFYLQSIKNKIKLLNE